MYISIPYAITTNKGNVSSMSIFNQCFSFQLNLQLMQLVLYTSTSTCIHSYMLSRVCNSESSPWARSLHCLAGFLLRFRQFSFGDETLIYSGEITISDFIVDKRDTLELCAMWTISLLLQFWQILIHYIYCEFTTCVLHWLASQLIEILLLLRNRHRNTFAYNMVSMLRVCHSNIYQPIFYII